MLVGSARCLSPGATARHACRCRPRCRRCWRRALIGCRRRTNACSRPPRSLAPRCPGRCSRPLPTRLTRRCTAAWRSSKPRSSSTRPACFPSRLHLQARPHARGGLWGSAARAAARAARPHCRGAGGPGGRPAATSRWNGWRSMPCGARCGTRPWPMPPGRGQSPARSAYREAVVCFEQALVALAHLPESASRDRAGHRPSARLTPRAQCPGRSAWADASTTCAGRGPGPDARRSPAAGRVYADMSDICWLAGELAPRHRLRPACPGPGRHARSMSACRPWRRSSWVGSIMTWETIRGPSRAWSGMWRPSRETLLC